jgi:amino acid adenylation domain-containing protein
MIRQLILTLSEKKVSMKISDNDLMIDAPEGILDPDLIERIKSCKQELIAYLSEFEKNNRDVALEIKKLPDQINYHLSSSQNRLWVLNQLEGGNVAYIIPGFYELNGKINRKILSKAFTNLISRHEILRTVFKEDTNREVKQWVKKAGDLNFSVTYSDLRKKENKDFLLKEFINKEIKTPFDLSTGPLLRAKLIHLDDNKYVFALLMHHIISDGWSVRIFINDLLLLYNSFLKGDDSPLKPLLIQYRDYAAWQQKLIKSDHIHGQKDYWLKQLNGNLPTLNLPIDFVRPKLISYNGNLINKVIAHKVLKDHRQLSKNIGGTLFMSLLTTLNILLYKCTNQKDIIVGCPIAGRENVDLEPQIGFYINTLALRCSIDEDDTFESLLDKVKQIMMGAYRNQMYPFDNLVEELVKKRDTSRNMLFDVMIVMQNTDVSSKTKNNDLVENVDVTVHKDAGHVVSKYDLTFYFNEANDDLLMTIEYNTDLFKHETVESLANSFTRLLEIAKVNVTKKINELIFICEMNDTVNIHGSENSENVSEHQKRLWFIDQFEKNTLYDSSPVYHNLSHVVKLNGELRINDLNISIDRVINNHAILKTIVVSNNGTPEAREVNKVFEDIKLKEYIETDENGLKDRIFQLVNKPFNLESGPLIRFEIAKINYQCFFIIAAHHIIIDRESLKLIFKEIYSVYQKSNLEVISTETLAFSTFLGNQNKLYGDGKRMPFFWKNKLEFAPVLYLDTDNPREPIHIYEAERAYSSANYELTSRIKNYCSQNGQEPFTFFRAVFSILMYKYSGSTEIVIGTMYNNRNLPETKSTIGPLANLIAIKSVINSESDFNSLLRQVKKDHEFSNIFGAVPFEKVVLEINPDKDMSRTALFDILLHYEKDEYLATSNDFQLIEFNSGLGKYDINLLIKESHSFEFFLTFNKRYFNTPRIQRLLGHINNIIEYVLEWRNPIIKSIRHLSSNELVPLLSITNNDTYNKNETIVDHFEKQVERTPSNIAIEFKDRILTYDELNKKVNQFANYIITKYQIEQEEIVALVLKKNEWMPLVILAVLKAGGAYLPIDPEYPQERINYILEDSKSRVIIDEAILLDFQTQERDFSQGNLERRIKHTALAYIIYTSGTTGNPKGSLIEHRNLVSLFKTNKFMFEFNSNDVWTLFHSYCFDFSVWEMFGALLFGGKLIVVPKEISQDTKIFLELLIEKRITVLNQTPSAFYNLLKFELERNPNLPDLRYVIFGGEALAPSQLKNWKKKYPKVKLINMYGITETTVHVTYKEINEHEIEGNLNIIGRPIPTLSCYVLDVDQNLVPTGVSGELYVGGSGVCRGYLNNSELTKEKFVTISEITKNKLYRSGDKVKILENGELEYIGRVDSQVKIRGYRIELSEIENTLRKYDRISDVVVLITENAMLEKQLIAYVVTVNKTNIKDIREYLSRLLPSYMIPAFFVQMSSLPLTSNGKIDRKALLSYDQTFIESETEYTIPTNPVEIKLSVIWAETLRIDVGKIRREDNFFYLGGHSLRATRLLTGIFKEFSVKLELQQIFVNQKLCDQANLISGSISTFYSRIKPARKKRYYDLSHAQKRLWIQYQSDRSSRAYNMLMAYEVDGFIDEKAFQKCIQHLLARHEILRTIFFQINGTPKQKIVSLDGIQHYFTSIDLSAHENADSLIKKTLSEEWNRQFDLLKGPLIKLILLKTDINKYMIILNMHHIISDGWSMNVIINELLSLYKSFITKKKPSLIPLNIQYKDYSEWHNEQIHIGSKYRDYWMTQLINPPPPIELHYDYSRPEIKTHNGSSCGFSLNASISNKLRGFAKDRGTTLFMNLLGFINVLLYKYSGQKDIIIGTPIAGREHSDLEGQIGFFLNTLAIRTKIEPEKTFIDLIECVKKTSLDAFSNQLYPFDLLVEELNVKRDFSRSPLFDIMMVLQNNESPDSPSVDTLKILPYNIEEKIMSKYDMTFYFNEITDRIFVSIVYNTDLFTAETIENLKNNFLLIIETVLSQPEEKLTDVRLVLTNDQDEEYKRFIG